VPQRLVLQGKIKPHKWPAFGTRFTPTQRGSPLNTSEIDQFLSSRRQFSLSHVDVSANTVPQWPERPLPAGTRLPDGAAILYGRNDCKPAKAAAPRRARACQW
jgi:hypothetical protein